MSDPEIIFVDQQHQKAAQEIATQASAVPQVAETQPVEAKAEEVTPEFEGAGKSNFERFLDGVFGWGLIRFASSNKLLNVKRKMLEKKTQQSGSQVILEDKKYGS